MLPTLSKPQLDKAVLEALGAMHNLGAYSPNIYKSTYAAMEGNIYIKACQIAIISARQVLKRQKEADKMLEVNESRNDRQEIADVMWALYREIKADFVAHESKFPAVDAYEELLKVKNLDLSGYRIFLVFWRIPQDEGIFDHPRVIAACSAHPVLPDRGETKMRINNEKPYSFI